MSANAAAEFVHIAFTPNVSDRAETCTDRQVLRQAGWLKIIEPDRER